MTEHSDNQTPSSQPSSDAPDGGVSGVRESIETENLIATYDCVAEWIRFADAKAAAVLTVAGATIGVLVPGLRSYLSAADAAKQPLPWWNTLVLTLFVVWLVLTLISIVLAFRCILPYRRRGVHPSLQHCTHFHPAAISSHYGIDEHERFVADYERGGSDGFRREILAGLLIDSHISASKYTRVTASIRLFGWSVLVALGYLLAVQF